MLFTTPAFAGAGSDTDTEKFKFEDDGVLSQLFRDPGSVAGVTTMDGSGAWIAALGAAIQAPDPRSECHSGPDPESRECPAMVIKDAYDQRICLFAATGKRTTSFPTPSCA